MKLRKGTTRTIWHHTLSPDVDIATVDKWHKARGFIMAGYHYLIRANGVIENGRPLPFEGAHAKGRNHNSIGIAFAGDFSKHRPTHFQLESAKSLYYDLFKKYGRRLDIDFHRGESDKDPCPGMMLDRDEFIETLLDCTTKKEDEMKYNLKKGILKGLRDGVIGAVAVEGAKASNGKLPATTEDALEAAVELLAIALVQFLRNLIKQKFGKKPAA